MAIEFTLNGQRTSASDVSPTMTLLQYLRGPLGATGTKEGCAEGDCGACTVAIVDPDAPQGATFRAVNSCLVLLPMVHGKDVFTVEGLADGGPHPVQASLVEKLGSQCGFCTPGVIMSMFEACYRKDLDEPWKLDDQMCGNLCRCTGYRPIRDATEAIASLAPSDRFAAALEAAQTRRGVPSYEHADQKFFAPATFDELFDVLDANPEREIVCGGTDLSLRVTKRFERLGTVVSLEGVETLRGIERTSDVWRIGATTPLADLEDAARDGLEPIERMLRFFGARQIKNRGTIGGNLCTASPIGDLAPVLLALNATVALVSRQGRRTVPLSEFFLGYRQTALEKNEILEAVLIPAIEDDARVGAYKVSKRQELDISTVSLGAFVRLDDANTVVEVRLAFGGMAATPVRAAKAEAALVGQPWTEDNVDAAVKAIDTELSPLDDHRGSAWYRSTVAKNLVRGFYFETLSQARPRLVHRPAATVVL